MSDVELAPPTPEVPPRSRRRPLLVAVLLVLVLALASSPWWAPLALGQLAYFRLRRVEVRGAYYIAPSDILRRLSVDTSASVWQPLAPLTARVSRHPGLLSARVRRALPGTLVVSVVERQPVALVAGPTGFQAFDESGVALPIDLTRVPVDAPILRQRDTTLFRLIGRMRVEAPSLYRRLGEARRQGQDEVVLRLDSTVVRATTDVSPARLLELEPVEQDLATRRVRVAELDLRFRDQVIARLP
ncbi:MAG TPA: FtsQ-type POTRA domain-containing protein [Gemmatimonadaceae bacterium]|nr:FtsQ-type POTRA domain-containing protein [Gemmatimonadaceae bacterium]